MTNAPALTTRKLIKAFKPYGVKHQRRGVGGRIKGGRDNVELYREDNPNIYTVIPDKRGGDTHSWPTIKIYCENLQIDPKEFLNCWVAGGKTKRSAARTTENAA